MASLLGHEIAKTAIDIREDFGGGTALSFARCSGHGDVVKLLLEHGADPTVVHHDGNNLMGLAIAFGHDEIAGLLQVSEPI